MGASIGGGRLLESFQAGGMLLYRSIGPPSLSIQSQTQQHVGRVGVGRIFFSPRGPGGCIDPGQGRPDLRNLPKTRSFFPGI